MQELANLNAKREFPNNNKCKDLAEKQILADHNAGPELTSEESENLATAREKKAVKHQ